MKWIVIATVSLLTLCGCASSSSSPDRIRRDTANATAAAARDTKAIAQGVVEGLKTKGPLNINRATKEQLETLPGIDSAAADRVIAGRPYKNSDELPRRRVISRAEYDRIASKIEAR
ncbi:MAG: ComEA family DNA-binding protein [Acidobacteriaceae bacterium]